MSHLKAAKFCGYCLKLENLPYLFRNLFKNARQLLAHSKPLEDDPIKWQKTKKAPHHLWKRNLHEENALRNKFRKHASFETRKNHQRCDVPTLAGGEGQKSKRMQPIRFVWEWIERGVMCSIYVDRPTSRSKKEKNKNSFMYSFCLRFIVSG